MAAEEWLGALRKNAAGSAASRAFHKGGSGGVPGGVSLRRRRAEEGGQIRQRGGCRGVSWEVPSFPRSITGLETMATKRMSRPERMHARRGLEGNALARTVARVPTSGHTHTYMDMVVLARACTHVATVTDSAKQRARNFIPEEKIKWNPNRSYRL